MAALLGTLTVAFASLTASPAAAVVIRQAEWPLDAQHYQAPQIWHLSQGQGVTVAVIDSGVDAAHPDLTGQVLPGTGFLGDRTDNGQTDISADSHGTAIAGIIAGTGAANSGSGMIGLAPKAKILPVRIATQGAVEPAALAEGVKYAADHHAQVINISLATPTPDPVLRQAIDYALGKDAVVVAAAGNSGQSGNPAMYPAAFPGVIDVSGIDAAGQFWPMSESGPRTTIAAPATNIYSANNRGQYVNAEGTSYAAAYVSAAAALVRSAFPHLSAGRTIQRLISTAQHPKGHDGPDNQYGYGSLDPLAALGTHAVASGSANPLLGPRPRPGGTGIGLGTITVFAAVTALVLAAATSAMLILRRSQRRSPRQNNRPAEPGKDNRPAQPGRKRRPAAGHNSQRHAPARAAAGKKPTPARKRTR
ncbi:type VII secretion-associated serine protease mycosin [Streptomyces sp. NPDC055966]|uniref:type VII secretion-associated serine protease mycosin n=1 Tax=Streptomyces sp. NPDC055966 TaxID=3345669 RepID=UPI0035D53935